MLTRRDPSIRGLPAIERTRISSCRSAASQLAAPWLGQISR
ncbi:hypothetical protein SynMINOS11_02417 [Synechococcus sp. Minos11]|nr:hypothetical protein SynMINOS11_02417 [Synechococcus sp. Minos11]